MVNLKHFKLGLFNAGSLCSSRKHDEFCAAAQQFKLDILAINETWLKAGAEGCAPSLPGYKLRHSPRKLGTRRGGGGVGFYISDCLGAKICKHPFVDDVEQMWIRVRLNSFDFIIGTAYRPPWLGADVFLDALSDSLASFSNFDYIILCGDFNIDLLNKNHSKTKSLLQFLDCSNIKKLHHATNSLYGSQCNPY